MRRILLPAVITVVVVALLAVLAFGVSSSGPSNALSAQVSRGQKPVAPNARMPLQLLNVSDRSASGKSATLSDYRGKIVMVDVFAGWCISCQDEVGLVKHAQRVLAQHGGAVVGVTYQDSSSDAAGFMQKYGLQYPVLLDPGDKFIAPYGVNGVPETFFIGRDGRVIAANPGEMDAKWLNQALKRVLGTQA